MAKHVKVTSPHDGRTRTVTKRMAKVLLMRGWTPAGAPAESKAPARQRYQTRHMEAAPVAPRQEPEHPDPDLDPDPEYDEDGPDPYEGVDFASDKAYEAARDAGLPVSAFRGRTGTGQGGAFTKPDVITIIEGWV